VHVAAVVADAPGVAQREAERVAEDVRHAAASLPAPRRDTQAVSSPCCEYISDPGVSRSSPVSSSVLRPERIIGQPP
jgi:hypothetical protein